MAENYQNYSVSYIIDVDASKGVKQVNEFAKSVGQLTSARTRLDGAVTNIKKMMDDIDTAFRTKSGKKRDYSYKFNIDTNDTETKLQRVKSVLTEIGDLTKGIRLVLNTDKPLNTKGLKATAKTVANNKAKEIADENSAKKSAESIIEAQKRITKSVGKVNAALIHMEKVRTINVNTEAAEAKLNGVLSLISKIKSSSSNGFTLKMNGLNPAASSGKVPGNLKYAPYNSQAFVMPAKRQQRMMEKIMERRALDDEKLAHQEREELAKYRRQAAAEAARRLERKAFNDQQRKEREEENKRKRDAVNSVKRVQQQAAMENSMYGGKRRAAINRLQYSRGPSMRNIPMAYMFNAYMAYSLMKSELTQAVEYSNIMETAHSILKVADSDLSTFETRFDTMARYVRQIGVETKFTAIEVAGAVKYLSMAGMGIETINASIRPITNLALIGDNDISQIADLATNIMAGYDIKSTSMGSVADILASTVSRSNVNIIEMAESYKMAAGYLKMAGVDFTESAAGIGILGNMGIKGTMAGTSLRAMATRFAKPTKQAQETMDRLGVTFTEYRDVFGTKVEKLKPLADIFENLKSKGASMADMQSIFGKIGGNAAMMFLENSDKLRELTGHNRASQGISGELAKVKQDTTKGLWFQVTSQFSEAFMQAYELLEPKIKSVLKNLLEKFSAPDFAKGLQAIGNVLLDIVSVLGNIATWFTKNFHWLEPLLFTGVIATRLFKLAGAITNVGVAMGFLGKKTAATSALQMIGGLGGFANKRALVSMLRGAGVTGKGAMTQALMGGAGSMLAGGGLFSTQVATGNGLLGAGASLSAIGTGAVAATAGIASLVGVLGWVAYKTWKIKEAKDAVLEELDSNRKYRYPSIESLNEQLSKAYTNARNAKTAIDDLTAQKTIEEVSGHKIGTFTSNWWSAAFGIFASATAGRDGNYGTQNNRYSTRDAYQDDAVSAIRTIADMDSQARINSAWAELGKLKDTWEVDAFKKNIRARYGGDVSKLDHSLWTTDPDGTIRYNKGIEKLKTADIHKTWHYVQYHNSETVRSIETAADAYRQVIGSFDGARQALADGGFNFGILEKNGFNLKDGKWVQNMPTGKLTDKQKTELKVQQDNVRAELVNMLGYLRQFYGGSGTIAEKIMQKAGFEPNLYSNEPNYDNDEPFKANRITNGILGEDDGKAGGNYSGTGKLSSAAPKQVIVKIDNLLSVGTIDLMKSKEGQVTEIQDLKEQLAQALIDTVHDFDASWNG